MLSRFLHILTTASLFYAGQLLETQYMWIGFNIYILYFLPTQFSIRKNLSKVNLTFFTTNGIASIIFGICHFRITLLNPHFFLISPNQILRFMATKKIRYSRTDF